MPCRAPLACLLALLAVSIAPAEDPALTLDLGDGVKMELVLIKKGTFRQGSPKTEAGRNDDEAQREVKLTSDFYLGKYPVTRRQFARFVKETGYRTEAERGPSGGFGWDGSKLVQRKDYTWRNPGFPQTEDHPVTIITYDDARAFCSWLTRKAFREVTLPTEAQWEYACRAGTTTRYYNGDDDTHLGDIAWFRDNAGKGTNPVGKKKANAWGLYDMAGNVHEWCRDWYGPYEKGPVTDPEEKRHTLTDPPRRVLRGGSWLREAKHCRSAARYRNTPGTRNADNGFRVVAAVALMLEKQDPGQGMAAGGIIFAAAPVLQVGDFGSGIICCVGVVVALAVLLVIVLVVSSRPRRPGLLRPAGREDVRIREMADGFWLELPTAAPGSEVRYRCRVHDLDRTGTVVYEPGPQGQFVYTGGRPSDVSVVAIIPPGQPQVSPPEPPPQPLPPSRAVHEYPPAY